MSFRFKPEYPANIVTQHERYVIVDDPSMDKQIYLFDVKTNATIKEWFSMSDMIHDLFAVYVEHAEMDSNDIIEWNGSKITKYKVVCEHKHYSANNGEFIFEVNRSPSNPEACYINNDNFGCSRDYRQNDKDAIRSWMVEHGTTIVSITAC